ncbi:MAG: sigma 54-interacting transcriptional regulator [Desulfovibrionaceae bacterium]|nr:sigma 54-interacting transcriptional regulator [Desulfovibrionaceae bacterium]
MLRDKTKSYELLLKINNAIVHQTTRETLFNALARELRSLIPYDRFSINLYDAERKFLSYFATAAGIPLSGISNQPRPLEKGIFAHMVIRTREPLVIPDLTRQTYFTSVENMLTVGLTATMVFPLLVRNTVLGSIHLSFRRAPENMDDLAEFCRELSSQVAIAVDNMLSHTKLKEMNEQLQRQKTYLLKQSDDGYEMSNLEFASPAMNEIMAQVEMVAGTDASVILTGETGTGKDFIARHIHKISQRRDGLLVKVNCPALAPSLFESELFGHSKGAFTGASGQRVGRFEMADGGTVFLDEIGDLPMPLQAKLLHVLQDQTFERVGDSRSIRVNFRVIAATNKNLEDCIREHTFRSDLFYRLSTITLHLPPLRERPEDIPPLLRVLSASQARLLHRPAPRYSDEVVADICRHSWPGNIRELKNLISRMIILRPGQEVSREDIRSHLGEATAETPGGRFPTLDEAECAHIAKALARAGGMVGGAKGAAALLGVPRSTLQYRMRKCGLSPEDFRRQAVAREG